MARTLEGIQWKANPTKGVAKIIGDSWKRDLFFIVYDHMGKRLEFRPGVGEVKVCIGYQTEWTTDSLGCKQRKEVPVYKTYNF